MEKDLELSGVQLALASGCPLMFGAVGCMLGGFLTDRQVRVWGRRWGRTGQGVIAYTLAGTLFLGSFLLTGVHAPLTLLALCLASFLKDFGMAASWSTTLDIGHRYSGSVAGVMNSIGNMGTVFSPPIVAWLVHVMADKGEVNWAVSLCYYAAMFYVAAIAWLFINPCRVIVYKPEDHQRLVAEGVIE
jgi:MFS family permease